MNIPSTMPLLAAVVAVALAACNHEAPVHPADETADPDAGRYHENSFLWTDAPGPLAKPSAVAELSEKATDFPDGDAFVAALEELERKLEEPGFARSLWKPLDHACDELDLALWNTYGTVRVDGTTVLDESILRSRCSYVGDDAEALAKPGFWWSEHEVTDRQYPYKMIGKSWQDFNLLYYKSTGGSTQFKKHREKLWVTAWWDTDASKIGVRSIFFICSGKPVRTCGPVKEKITRKSNTDIAKSVESSLPALSTNAPFILPASGEVHDAVMSFHSVNHAGKFFRARSHAAIDDNTILLSPISYEYIEW